MQINRHTVKITEDSVIIDYTVIKKEDWEQMVEHYYQQEEKEPPKQKIESEKEIRKLKRQEELKDLDDLLP